MLEERGLRVFEVSAATHEGLRELTFALAEMVAAARAAAPVGGADPDRAPARAPSTTPGFTVAPGRRRAPSWSRGEKPERWVRQTDFTNDEAVGYLADRLARLGVEEALAKAGAQRRAPRSPSADGGRLRLRLAADAQDAGGRASTARYGAGVGQPS